MLTEIKGILYEYAHSMSLELFAFTACLIEEILPPIPVPSVITIVGAVAKIQDYSPYSLLALVLIGTIGKTFGAITVYYVVDKLEDFFVHRFGKYFNLQEDTLEQIGQKIGQGKRSYLVLILLRATPLFPSTLISISCGLLKIPLKLFIISTFIGSLIRNSLYIYIGFGSITAFNSFFLTLIHISVSTKILIAFVVLGIFIYFLRQKLSQ
jgi:membrane protein DedA with SNARE-associated domain